jgi:hypothetical protein
MKSPVRRPGVEHRISSNLLHPHHLLDPNNVQTVSNTSNMRFSLPSALALAIMATTTSAFVMDTYSGPNCDGDRQEVRLSSHLTPTGQRMGPHLRHLAQWLPILESQDVGRIAPVRVLLRA